MLDLKQIRDDADGVSAALARRDASLAAVVGEVLEADAQWRAATTSAESLRAEQKARSEEFGAAKARGEDAPELRTAMQEMSAQVKSFNEQATTAKQRLDELVQRLPNIPDAERCRRSRGRADQDRGRAAQAVLPGTRPPRAGRLDDRHGSRAPGCRARVLPTSKATW